MRRIIMLAATVAATIATPALARDRYGYQAIAAGDFVAAERTLDAERRIFPDRPELLLNLASVYRHTGRADRAREMYREALRVDAVDLTLPTGGEASSHALARAGLASLDAPLLATR